MPPLDKNETQAIAMMNGLTHTSGPPIWKRDPTKIIPPSNERLETRQKAQNPFSKGRMSNNLGNHSTKGPPPPSAGNPNSGASVFTRAPKRRKTQNTPSSTNSGSSDVSKHRSVDRAIDLTEDDAEPPLHGPTAADDSGDSLNIRPAGQSRSRIADDGRATRRLRADHRGGGSSKAADPGMETDEIEDFPGPTTAKEQKGKVRNMVQALEYRSGGRSTAPRLNLAPDHPALSGSEKFKPSMKSNVIPILESTQFTNASKSKEHLAELRDHFLSFGPGGGKPTLCVTSANGHQEFRFGMTKNEIQDLQATDAEALPFIISFGVRSLQQNPAPEFLRPGSNDRHCVMAFRVDTDDRSCTPQARKAFHSFLRDRCACKAWLGNFGARGAWDSVLQGLSFPTPPQPGPQQLPPPTTPNVARGRERHNSVPSDSEFPPSIKLSPPPRGEVPDPPKTSQKVERMKRRQTIVEQRNTRGVVEDEPIAGPSNQPQRRSLRQLTLHSSLSAVDPIPASPPEDPDELLLVYRPLGTGAVNITRGDLERLQPGKYLNDTLIEFGLKLWLNDLRDRDPGLVDQIHLFSSFFYKKLAVKDKRAGYESVRKWTSKVDVFSKKYLVVPINEHLHWYLAIIYQPEHILQPPQPLDSPMTRKRKRDEELSIDSAIEASELRETPTTVSKPTSKATTGIPEQGEMEIVPDSERSDPGMEVEEQTQTDETTKPEEQEVETQLCAEVSSVSLDEHEQEGSELCRGERDVSTRTSSVVGEEMEVDDSPLNSPMRVDREVNIEDLIGEPTPHGTTEPSVVDAEDPSPAVDMDGPFDHDTIGVGAFYGKPGPPTRANGKGKPRFSAPTKPESHSNEGDPDANSGAATLKADHTYVFVFDSLNGKHPGAMKNLAQYLRFEAMDKKGTENPSSPEGIAAPVPAQNNYCDCGLYLLHFAKVFMEDPAKAFNTILTKRKSARADREVDWKNELVGNSRENLTQRIHELGEMWIKERAKEAEEKAKAKEKEGGSKPESIAVDSQESDEEIIVQDFAPSKRDPSKEPAKRPNSTRKGAATQQKGRNSKTAPAEAERAPAERFR